MIWELSGAQGKNPTIVPNAATPTSIKWQMTNMPTGKASRFWYYLTAVVIALTFTVSQTSGEGVNQLEEEMLYRIVQSIQIYTPILGMQYQHSNTRGTIMGNLIQYAGFGYNGVGQVQGIPTATASVTQTIYLRIPFAHEQMKKPHEFSPWGGFFEGGNVEILIAPSTVFAGFSALASVTTVTARCWCEFIPAPEAVIHVPFNWREHTNIAVGARITIPDVGSPDGLQGIDQSRGCGVVNLWDLMLGGSGSSLGLDLLGNTTADNIAAFDIPWRDQTRMESPDAFFMALAAMMGNNRRTGWNGAGTPDVTDRHSFPWTDTSGTASPNGPLNLFKSMIFPFIAGGRDLETSKIQTVAGAKDINITYVAPVTTAPRLLGMYTYVFDDAFVKTVLIPRISPAAASQPELTAKTLNKQTGGTYGVGKLAYVRQKIQNANT